MQVLHLIRTRTIILRTHMMHYNLHRDITMLKWEQAIIDKVLHSADLNNASFTLNKEEDQRIKEAIRLWLHTWITQPLIALRNGERY